jgi:hypothetical protein
MRNDHDSIGARIVFQWVPLIASALTLIASIVIDHIKNQMSPGMNWHLASRSGAIIALCGAVSAYGGATRCWIRHGDLIRGIRQVPYGEIGLALGLAGTVIWGYGDLWL